MLTKRIIPCLDIKDGRTVKGTNFLELRDAGDPVELATVYALNGADELVFLDITATHERRKTLSDLVRRIAKSINIPFTVGGGITSVEDVRVLLDNGADKISVNSAAFKRPELISKLASEFGSQCVVLAVDIKKNELNQYEVFLNGGRLPTGRECADWITEAVKRGAGEILLTSMDHDGVKNGFAVEITARISNMISVPVIASGGAGTPEHFAEVLQAGADAALAASIFHFKEVELPFLKQYLKEQKLPIR